MLRLTIPTDGLIELNGEPANGDDLRELAEALAAEVILAEAIHELAKREPGWADAVVFSATVPIPLKFELRTTIEDRTPPCTFFETQN